MTDCLANSGNFQRNRFGSEVSSSTNDDTTDDFVFVDVVTIVDDNNDGDNNNSNPSTLSQIAEKKAAFCGRCRNHGESAQWKSGHKRECPWRTCDCLPCTMQTQRRSETSKPIDKLLKDALKSAQKYDENGNRIHYCRRCQLHGKELVPLKGHKWACEEKWANCHCEWCRIIVKKRENDSESRKHSRKQAKEASPKNTEIESEESLKNGKVGSGSTTKFPSSEFGAGEANNPNNNAAEEIHGAILWQLLQQSASVAARSSSNTTTSAIHPSDTFLSAFHPCDQATTALTNNRQILNNLLLQQQHHHLTAQQLMLSKQQQQLKNVLDPLQYQLLLREGFTDASVGSAAGFLHGIVGGYPAPNDSNNNTQNHQLLLLSSLAAVSLPEEFTALFHNNINFK